MPGVPGVPEVPGLPTNGQGGAPDAPATGKLSIPVPQRGSPSGEDGSPAGSPPSAGTGREKSDDEILAEALEELNKRSGAPQQAEGGDGAAGQLPQADAGGPAATGAERKQALGDELQEGFAEFDRVMLSEQQAMNEEADQEGYGDFSDEGGMPGELDAAAEEPLQTAMIDSDPVSIKGEGNTATRDHSQVPPDLVNAEGDDIIARQLREAAMKEQDPELREKLWDEYRKYKRDLR